MQGHVGFCLGYKLPLKMLLYMDDIFRTVRGKTHMTSTMQIEQCMLMQIKHLLI